MQSKIKTISNLLKKSKITNLNNNQSDDLNNQLNKRFYNLSITSTRIKVIHKLCQINNLPKFKSKNYSTKILKNKTPKELELILLKDFKVKIEITDTDKESFEKYFWIETNIEIFP